MLVKCIVCKEESDIHVADKENFFNAHQHGRPPGVNVRVRSPDYTKPIDKISFKNTAAQIHFWACELHDDDTIVRYANDNARNIGVKFKFTTFERETEIDLSHGCNLCLWGY